MKVIDSERTIEGAHAPGAPPLDAQQLNFDRAGEASVDQTDSPADNKTVPTQLAHSGRQHATRTTPKRGTAVGYIRVSTEDQTQGYSLDAQRAGIQEYCERNGYQLVRIYADEGVSAHTDKISKRPQLRLLLEHATQGQFDVVVVHTLDRWARNMRVHVEALQRLIDARVGFASVTEDIDFNTAIGRVMMALLAAFAEFFSSQLGEHVKKAVKQRAAQGLQNGSAPFGYLRDDETGIPCPVPEEAEAVRTVFAKRAAGETSGKIAVRLNAAGFRTRRGNTFTDGSVRDMLGFRFYLGVVRLGDEEFPGQHEGIIAPELFERVQTRTVKRGPALHTAGGARGLLAGIIRCGHCGDRLQADRNSSGNPLYRERPVFVCKTEGEPGALGCKTAGKSRVASHIDAQMGDIFGSLVLPQDWKQRIARQSVRTEGPSVSDLQGRRLRLGRSYRDETITEEEYQREREELDAQLRIAQLSTTIELDEVAELLENLAELWGAAKPDERRRLLRTLVEAVHVDIESKCIVGITPVPAFTKLIESAMERTAGCRAVLCDPKKVENLESIGLLGARQAAPADHGDQLHDLAVVEPLAQGLEVVLGDQVRHDRAVPGQPQRRLLAGCEQITLFELVHRPQLLDGDPVARRPVGRVRLGVRAARRDVDGERHEALQLLLHGTGAHGGQHDAHRLHQLRPPRHRELPSGDVAARLLHRLKRVSYLRVHVLDRQGCDVRHPDPLSRCARRISPGPLRPDRSCL